MSLKHGLLGLLSYFPMSGYDLDKAFKESLSFFWQANTSQVYRELNAMEKTGWLTSETVIQNDKPNKKLYHLTEVGRKELEDWVSTVDETIESSLKVRSPFLMGLFFAGEMDIDSSINTIKEFKNKCVEEIEDMHRAYDAIGFYQGLIPDREKAEFWELTAMFGDEYFKAGIIWADKALEKLQKIKDRHLEKTEI